MSVELLRAAITASGLSVPRFAREVLGRHPRTVWRWLAGDTIPEVVVELLRQLAKVSKVSKVLDDTDIPPCSTGNAR